MINAINNERVRALFKLWALAALISFVLGLLAARAAAEEPKDPPRKDPPVVPKPDVPKDDPPKKDPADDPAKPVDKEKDPAGESADLRTLIGVNPVGLKRVDVPHMPAMSLRGFIQPRGQPSVALLEIAELNRVFLVKVGTEIPITVAGRVAPVGRNELTGLGGPAKNAAPAAQQNNGRDQSQIILKVLKVSGEGVTVEAGLLAQTIIIR